MTLAQLHPAIASLLLTRGNLRANEVDVCFELPTKAWVDSLAFPTINLFLFDMAEKTELRNLPPQVSRGNGHATTRMPPRRVELHYLVCAFSSVTADEHALLWRTMATLLKHTTVPRELLHEALQRLDIAVQTKVGRAESDPRALELWGGLDLPPRPALFFSVTAPMDLELEFETPLVLTRVTRFTRASADDERLSQGIDPARVSARGGQEQFYEPHDGVVTDRRARQPRFAIAGVVRDREGNPLKGVVVGAENRAAESTVDAEGREQTVATDAAGRFALANLRRDDRLWVRRGDAKKLLEIYVPSPTYDIVLD